MAITTSVPLRALYSSYTSPYCEVTFHFDRDKALRVTIETERLRMRSVESSEEEVDRFSVLFGDSEVMAKFGMGKIYSREKIKEKIDSVWADRWRRKFPYSALAVFEKETGEFMGGVFVDVCLFSSENPGESGLCFLFHKKFWKKGFATEAVAAVIEDFLPATIQEGHTVRGRTLETVYAAVRSDIPSAAKVLRSLGMSKYTEASEGKIKWHYFSLSIGKN